MAKMAATNSRPCLNCGGTMRMRRETVQVIGLPSVSVQDVAVWTCQQCGERETSFDRIEDLHRAIATELVMKRSSLSGAEMRFLRGLTGLSTDDYARDLDVAAATLSRIENERQPASLSLERLFRFTAHLHLRLEPAYPPEILGPLSGGGRMPLMMSFAFDGEHWSTTTASREARKEIARRRAASAR